MEQELMAEQIQVERKRFSFYLKQNEQGSFLKITEEVGSRRGAIIIPGTGLRQVAEIIRRAAEAPAPSAGPPA